MVALIDACTDKTDDPAAPRDASTWRARKQHHVRELFRLAEDDPTVVLVPLADTNDSASESTCDKDTFTGWRSHGTSTTAPG